MASSSSAQSTASSSSSRFYGHEAVATTAARYITHLFACPNVPPPSSSSSSSHSSSSTAAHSGPPLANFIAYALYRTQLPAAVTSSALVLLTRLKTKYPAAKGSSGHRLFLASFMNASKMLCDDTYSNKSWVIVGQGLFPLKEVNQMEREMLNYLDWKVNACLDEVTSLEAMLDAQFSLSSSLVLPSLSLGPSPVFPPNHPTSASSAYPHHTIAPSPTTAAASYPSPPCSPCASPSHPRERFSSVASVASASSTPSSSSSSPAGCDTPPPVPASHHSHSGGEREGGQGSKIGGWQEGVRVVRPEDRDDVEIVDV